jgi:glycosyltransferase involved in cell wall biosynthesis
MGTHRHSAPPTTGPTGRVRPERLLVLNLAVDDADPILGFCTDWIRALADRVAQVDVLTMRLGSCDLPSNVRVYSAGKERGWSEPRRLLEFYLQLGRLLAGPGYAGCFAHMQPLFALLGAPLLKLRRVPVTLWYTHRDTTLRLRAAVRVSDRVISADRNSLGVPTTKLVVTGHGIDTDRFAPEPRPGSSYRVLVVGRIAPVKRLELLVEAVSLLEGSLRRDLEVRLVGPTDPPNTGYRAGLQRRARELGVGSVFSFVGPLTGTELVSEYQAAGTLVSLTGRGTFDKSVLEAMSCGVPPITMNPAFAPHLAAAGAPLPIAEGDVPALARALAGATAVPADARTEMGRDLRDQVVRYHSLRRLIDLLVDRVLFPPNPPGGDDPAAAAATRWPGGGPART